MRRGEIRVRLVRRLVDSSQEKAIVRVSKIPPLTSLRGFIGKSGQPQNQGTLVSAIRPFRGVVPKTPVWGPD